MKRNFILVLIILFGFLSAAAMSLWRAVPFSIENVSDLSRYQSNSLYDRNGVLFHVRLSPDGEWSIPIPLEKMGKWLPIVAVGIEDRRFYSHSGLDYIGLARAIWQNISSRRIVSGASTITSQVIRLSITEKSGYRKREFGVKLVEFIQAMKLEQEMPKDEILETYLNRAPFGGNIRGVEAAARSYFGKSAENISPGEASLLIGMLVAPTIHRPDTYPENALRRRNSVISRLEDTGVFSAEQARLARAEPLPKKRFPMPSRAYHYTKRLLEETQASGKLQTGLDINVQTALEKILSDSVSGMPNNITAAGGIIDNETNQLIAWVGNARFGEKTSGSWVDCGIARRSPGSTLKTFAWIEAFDQGKLTPGSLLADTPIAFSGRAPRNFDLSYRGAVSARVALSDSLNAPAVRVLRLASTENVLRLLRGSGFSSLTKSSSYYGDSLILGGCEVRLSEMLEGYSTIANGGKKFLGSNFIASPGGTKRVFSEASAWLVSDILSDTRRLSFVTREALEFERHRVAFKTGTSYGLRDAWTVAWTPRFTAAVWFGDPSGYGWTQLVGLNTATPPALRALRLAASLTKKGGTPAWFERPDDLAQQTVCSLSGKPPTAACPNTRKEWMILNVTSILPCDLHTVIEGKNTTVLPPELEFLSPSQGLHRADRHLKIVSPLDGGRYFVSTASKEQQKIPLRAEGGQSNVIYWFVDGRFVGESSSTLPFFYTIAPGNHKISAMDQSGQTASSSLNVVTALQPKEEILTLE